MRVRRVQHAQILYSYTFTGALPLEIHLREVGFPTLYARGVEILTGALKNVFQTYRDKCDEVENERENVFKTYGEVRDKMGNVSLSHTNRLS